MLAAIASQNDWEHFEEALDNFVNSRKRLAENYQKIRQVEGDTFSINGVEIPVEFESVFQNVGSATDINSLSAFFKNLAANPSITARVDLFRWIKAQQSMALTESGYIVGYRGLRNDMYSVMAGYGEVTRPGVETEYIAQDRLDNSIGNIVSMPRAMVDHNPNNSCSFGLHVGTWDYAKNWGDQSTTVLILLDPADVVVVPNGEDSKMRVCRYKVIDFTTGPITEFVYDTEEEF